MLRVATFAAACAVACSAVPAEAATIFSYVAIGDANRTEYGRDERGYRLISYRSYAAWAQGYVHFDYRPEVNSFVQTSVGAYNIYYDLTGSISGDTLSLSYTSRIAPIPNYRSTFGLSVIFDAGYLSGVFPTAIDFSKVVGGSVSYTDSFYGPSDITTVFSGSLASISSRNVPYSPLGGIGGDVFVIGGVPEPATWAMMIAGFGAIGGAMRVRRRTARAGVTLA